MEQSNADEQRRKADDQADDGKSDTMEENKISLADDDKGGLFEVRSFSRDDGSPHTSRQVFAEDEEDAIRKAGVMGEGYIPVVTRVQGAPSFQEAVKAHDERLARERDTTAANLEDADRQLEGPRSQVPRGAMVEPDPETGGVQKTTFYPGQQAPQPEDNRAATLMGMGTVTGTSNPPSNAATLPENVAGRISTPAATQPPAQPTAEERRRQEEEEAKQRATGGLAD